MWFVRGWKEGKTQKTKNVSCNTCLNKNFSICIFNKNKCNLKSAVPAVFQTTQMREYKLAYLPYWEGCPIHILAYPSFNRGKLV